MFVLATDNIFIGRVLGVYFTYIKLLTPIPDSWKALFALMDTAYLYGMFSD